MPLDPFTGQQMPYGQEPIAPLPMRLMENAPGITAGVLFNAGRGSRTMLAGGGFMDDPIFMGSRRAAKYGAFMGDNLVKSNKAFTRLGIKRGIDGMDPFLYGSRVNNVTMRPRALRRFSSLSVFGATGTGTYSYAGGVRALGKMRFGPLGNLSDTVGAAAGESILGPGLFSAIRAGSFSDKYERKLLVEGKQKYAKKLGKIDQTITRLASINNPSLLKTGVQIDVSRPVGSGVSYAEALKMTPAERGGLTAKQFAGGSTPIEYVPSTYASAVDSGMVGARGNLLVSSLGGQGTQYMGGFIRGAMGFAEAGGLSTYAQRGATRAVEKGAIALSEAFGRAGVIGKQSGVKYLGMEGASNLLKAGIRKELGFGGALKFAGSREGMQVLTASGAGSLLKAASPIGTAMLVYDLAKMGGEIIKSGINLARDAEKSLQGSFSKPTFGMGYRDTEAAATSRSRGVMAIQNSRLNARSALGTEGAMMAAHFG